MAIDPLANEGYGRRDCTAPLDTTLLALLATPFDECSYYGSPEARDRELAELLGEDEALEDGDWVPLRQLLEEREARRRGSA